MNREYMREPRERVKIFGGLGGLSAFSPPCPGLLCPACLICLCNCLNQYRMLCNRLQDNQPVYDAHCYACLGGQGGVLGSRQAPHPPGIFTLFSGLSLWHSLLFSHALCDPLSPFSQPRCAYTQRPDPLAHTGAYQTWSTGDAVLQVLLCRLMGRKA